MWEAEIAAIIGALTIAPDDAAYLQARADLVEASASLEAGTRHARAFGAEIGLGPHRLGYGVRGSEMARGLYLRRAGTTLRAPVEEWTPVEMVDAHAAVPELLAALQGHAATTRRGA